MDHHVAKIAAALAPSPGDFQFIGITHGGARCACGTPIFVQFILRAEHPYREVKVGSTCILATIPWLIHMDANGLAEAVANGWTSFVKSERHKKTTADGEARLREILPLAALLELWAGRVLTKQLRSVVPFPAYLRSFTNGSFLSHNASTPGRRAAALVSRLKRFADSANALKVLVEKRGLAWEEPPTSSVLPDEWYDMRISAEELMRLARICVKTSRYYQLIAIKRRHELTAIVNAPIPIPVNDMSAWMTSTQAVLEASDAFITEASRDELNQQYLDILTKAEAAYAKTEPFRKLWPNLAGTQHLKLGNELYALEEQLSKLGARFTLAKSNLPDLAMWWKEAETDLPSFPHGAYLTAIMERLDADFGAYRAQHLSRSSH